MTLAAILLLSILGLAPAGKGHNLMPSPPRAIADAAPSAPPASNKHGQNQDQAGAPAQSAQPATEPDSATQQKKSSNPNSQPAVVHHHAKKKAASVNCNPTPAKSDTTAPDKSGSTIGNTHGVQNSTSKPPTNCPPKKTIVPQGGTTEPSIELAGAASDDEAARTRNAVDQMVAVTENNLKNISGQTMSSGQKDQVNQIRQYLTESKGAVADGDLERARTLAWKAQMLSEDLVKSESNR
jgi:hypothetical protein